MLMAKKNCNKHFQSKNNNTKKKFKNRRNRNKSKAKGEMVGQLKKTIPSLSKRQVSSNWMNFLKTSGVDKLKKFLEKPQETSSEKVQPPPETTKVLALDCEMVADVNNVDMLARVSIVNYNLQCIYDKFVKPTAEVGDYRTRFSGIRKENLLDAPDFQQVKKEVVNLLKEKIIVGHALHNDFRVLQMKIPSIFLRDTSVYPEFAQLADFRSPSLKKLAKHFLNENIQEGEHNSIEDAKTAMKLYKKFNQQWELHLKNPKSKKGEQSKNKV